MVRYVGSCTKPNLSRSICRLMNYLPLAAKSGAEIFCNIQAQYVKPAFVVDSDGVRISCSSPSHAQTAFLCLALRHLATAL